MFAAYARNSKRATSNENSALAKHRVRVLSSFVAPGRCPFRLSFPTPRMVVNTTVTCTEVDQYHTRRDIKENRGTRRLCREQRAAEFRQHRDMLYTSAKQCSVRQKTLQHLPLVNWCAFFYHRPGLEPSLFRKERGKYENSQGPRPLPP